MPMSDDQQDAGFASHVYALVAQIPMGRLMTYGQIAALCGSPRAARQVGGVAHYGPVDLPWHRVVNKQGRLAAGFHGGRSAQSQLLQAEGVTVAAEHVTGIDALIWWPRDT
jgi:methylated-DNA-protein-cysteine methyltransferase-like protein